MLTEEHSEAHRPVKPAERALFDAATALFYERGYHGTSMRDIATALGLTPGALYNHIANKHELLHRIALGSIQELLDGGRRVLREHASASARLEAFVRFHVVYHAEHRLRAKVGDDQLNALEPESLKQVLAVRDEYEGVLRTVLQQGEREEGWLVADHAVVTFAIATMCTAVGVWYSEGGRLSAEEVAEVYVGFVTRGLQPAAQRDARSVASP